MRLVNVRQYQRNRLLPLAIIAAIAAACAQESQPDPGVTSISGDKNFLADFPSIISDCKINVVVEIPAGTNAKWETSKDGASIAWEFVDGKPRVVQFAPYPGNYGLVPRTLLPRESGGDGDPLDVLVLSEAAPRGSILAALPVAVLGLNDNGEIDDKIIAVPLDGPLSEVTDLDGLNRMYPGITKIVEFWFTGYKSGATVSRGFRDEVAACQLVKDASATFEGASINSVK